VGLLILHSLCFTVSYPPEALLFSRIKSKVLTIILSTSLGALLLLSAAGIVSIVYLRSASLEQGREIGDLAARGGQEAMQEQLRQQLGDLARDRAALTDEKLRAIQNQTEAVAEAASRISTYKRNRYQPKPIAYLEDGEIRRAEPFLMTAEGVSLDSVREEAYLAANVEDVLRQILVIESGITASYIGGESGYFISMDKKVSPSAGTRMDPRIREWYTGAKENDGIYWTNIFMDVFGRGIGIACSKPFYDFSQGGRVFAGVAASGALVADNVNLIIDSTRISDTSYAFLLDGKGLVIRDSSRGEDLKVSAGEVVMEDYLNGDEASLRDLAERMISGEPGLMEVEIRGKKMFAAYYPLSVIDWSLAVVAPVDEITVPARRIEQEILALTREAVGKMDRNIRTILLAAVFIIFFASLATVIFALRLSDSLAAPIVALCDGARIISAGDLNHRLTVQGTSEIVLLAETINQMVNNIRYVSGEKERIGTELNVAAHIQTSMLPGVFPPFPYRTEFDIYAGMHPAKEVGGDFYDFFFIDPDRVMTLIADVSGKGVPAALFMVIAKTLLKNQGQTDNSLDEVFSVVNNQLCENNDANMFVTVFACVLNLKTGLLRYANAGHNPPLISRSGGGYEFLELKRGLPMGVQEDFSYSFSEITLSGGDRLYLYTDGVNEAENPQGEQFGNGRLLDTANRYRDLPIKEFDLAFRASLAEFVNGAEQSDDITTLVLIYKEDGKGIQQPHGS
jgi:sigma-B regulation protein RsbU (phosphoserine phosphatase)